MLPSDRLADAIAVLSDIETAGTPVPETMLRKLFGITVRLYAATAERVGREFPPTDETIGTTEAVVAAVALLRAQNLNAFDTALWFSRTTPCS
jgi:hypothetical protein